MRIIKSFVTAAVSLLALESLTSAEMTGMSLQERMRQADVVVVGEILESRNTGKETEMGTEHWLAICQLKQIFKENFTKKIPSDGFNIYISFIQVPMRTDPPIKLTEGKKYLLFLKETGSQKEGQTVYEMITDLHGAFEAGQTYNVYDEQYPSGEMSFEAIVQRVTSQSSAPEPSQSLTLTIQADKQVYEVGEEIDVNASIKNLGDNTAKIYSPAYWGVSEITVTNSKGMAVKPEGIKIERVSFEPFMTILPKASATYTFDNLRWFHCSGAWQFADDAQLLPDTYKIYVTIASMPKCVGARYLETSLEGPLTSNVITITIAADGRKNISSQAACEKQGGHWGRFGLMEKEQCNRPTTDAGKKCTDHDECESSCVTEDSVPAGTEVTGKCYGWTVTLGTCMNGVKEGKAQGVICVD